MFFHLLARLKRPGFTKYSTKFIESMYVSTFDLFSMHVHHIVLGQDTLSLQASSSSARSISNVNNFYKEVFPLLVVGSERHGVRTFDSTAK